MKIQVRRTKVNVNSRFDQWRRRLVRTLVAGAMTLGLVPALAQSGSVLSHQKISDIEGGFTGILDDWDLFGHSVASLGDLDGDGVGDLAVGALFDGDGGFRHGAVWILFLNTDGTVKSHQKISSTEGGFTGVLDYGDFFGVSLASLGDLDGDAVGDLAVGARNDDDGGEDHGAVWVLFLNTDGTVKSHQKISATEGGFTGILDDHDWFGSSVASLGDLDGDGVGDLAVGAQGDDDGGFERGAVWVLFLNTDGTVKSHQKISSTEGGFTGILDDIDVFGFSVGSLGDLDGDGVGDLAVGAVLDDDGGFERGAVWVLFLNTDGTVKSHQKISDTEGGFTGVLEVLDHFGWSVASLGDLDGDGVGDLAVGAHLDDDEGLNRGAVWVLFLDGAREVLPDSFTILRGLLLSGGLPDLFDSDDSRLVVRTAVFAPSIEPPVQIEVVGTSPTESPSELRFRFEGMASRNLIERRISLYNYVTQSYEELHVAFAATSDEVVEIVITSNPSRFVEPGTGQVKSLMTWKAAAFSFFTGWNVGIDQTIWVVKP
ncbi:MAG: FG-GAP repeat protein [Armatimonadetes bacterium]|nr:FG-GAP repeat protein [Armatimonadota bacterium]